ncbi:MAG: spermidine/putrescine ABC transporter substrate-binding protein [Hallerella porci]|uniref:polyamine ABC transporter substrate-binding protein n=1 Tax=Hallerella porci TaxID=1945871 RepID=UPI001E56EAF6|nr:spermidine/putrescine ABC transporter substrate-binding protein [Hallerella porci]MDY3922591.1 spermidine/putrescine ABC transporter substrate-binding protein [Hallerella porci]
MKKFTLFKGNKLKKLLLALLVLAVAFLAGCKGKDKSAEKPTKVTVMIYSEYIDPAMLTDFESKTGYKLQLELYEAQEEMISKLQTVGTAQYDVIIASDVVIQQMIHLGLIGKIDMNKIPNRVNIADQFRNPSYDPTNEYTIPYLWGTTGILYRDSTIDPLHVSYSMLFDAKQTKGKFSLLEESRSMLSMALQAKGFDANSTNKDEINQAVEYILQAKKDPHFLGFDGSVGGKDKVLSKMDWAAIVFNGEAMAAIDEDPSLQFAIPEEGSFMWVDAMTLSSKAPNVDGAYQFMNYILDANIGAQLAKYINYATPNNASLEALDKEFTGNRVINPTADEIKRMVFLKDPGDAARLFDEAWTIVKTR